MAEIVITQQPLGLSVSTGQTATFTVAVNGDGVVTYQWFTTAHRIALLSGFNPLPGQEVDGFWPIVGATSASYTTPILQLGDTGGQFVCAIKNSESIPQSVGNLNFFGVYGPQTTPQQLFSQILTQPVVVLVIPKISFTVSDNFQRANENPLSDGGQWTTISGLTAMQVVSNVCEGANTSSNCGAVWTGKVWPNDQFSEVTIASIGNSTNIGPAVRGSISTKTLYLAVVNAVGAGLVAIEKFVNGSSSLITAAGITVSVNDVIRLEVQGTTLTCKQNGTVVLGPITDSDISSGSAGIYSTTGGLFATISNWDGGTL